MNANDMIDTVKYHRFDDNSSQRNICLETTEINNKGAQTFRSNVDGYKFLQDLYWYYELGGFWNIVFNMLAKGISTIFTLSFIIVLTSCIKWKKIFNKTLEKEHEGILKVPNENVIYIWISLSLVLFFVSVIWSGYWINRAWKLRKYCKETLLLDDKRIATYPWKSFIKDVATKDNSLLRKNNATWEDLIMVLLRKQNYLVALYNQRLIDVSVPGFPRWKAVTQVFEWAFSIATRDLWTGSGELNNLYLTGNHNTNVTRLQTRFYRTGLLALFLSPIVLVCLLIYVFFTTLEELHSSPGMLFSRTWSRLAEWRLRNFNEVNTALHDRLSSAYPHSRAYYSQFRNPISTTLARLLIYMLTFIAAPLIVITIFAEHALSYNLWAGTGTRSLLFFATLITTLLALLRSILPSDNYVFEPQLHMEKIVRHITLPPVPNYDWISDAHEPEIYNRFQTYFKAKWHIFVSELLAVITVPFIFMFSMVNISDSLLTFLKNYTIEEIGPGLGSGLVFCSLDASHTPIQTKSNISQHYITNDNVKSCYSKSQSTTMGNLEKEAEMNTSKDFCTNGNVDYHVIPMLTNDFESYRAEYLRLKLNESIIGFKGYYQDWIPTSKESRALLADDFVVEVGQSMYRSDDFNRATNQFPTLFRLPIGQPSLTYKSPLII